MHVCMYVCMYVCMRVYAFYSANDKKKTELKINASCVCHSTKLIFSSPIFVTIHTLQAWQALQSWHTVTCIPVFVLMYDSYCYCSCQIK